MSMSPKLSGKVAIVTGASKGIGAAIATHLAAAGASVVVNYSSSKEGADRVVDLIAKGGGKAIAVQANVAKKADIDRLFAEAKSAFGRVDILVNNAGIFDFKPLAEVTEEHFHRQFDLNVLGLLLTSQKAAEAFGEKAAASSTSAPSYPSARSPTAPFTPRPKPPSMRSRPRSRKNSAARKIRVNSLNPGMIETEGFHTAGIAGSDFQKTIEGQTPLGRIGQPDDIGPVAVFLASEDSRWITGQAILVSGGQK
jgi:3-oxoacyl-[acyl-carrier protein] reductase